MIRIHKEINKRLETTEIDEDQNDFLIEKGSWLSFKGITKEKMELVANKTGIPQHLLISAFDEEETARIDNESGSVLIVIDVPCIAKAGENEEEGTYETEPFIIAYNNDYFVTICQGDDKILNDLFAKDIVIEPQKHLRLALHLIYQMSKEFIYYLRLIDSHTKDIEKRLHSSMKNKELFELMAINKSLVYFSTALHADRKVLNRLLNSPMYKKFDDDIDLMEDTAVELDQALEMCQIYTGLLSGMMDAFPSIINNNLNIVMKTLAVITIVISIPTLVASFYGMNFTDIPLSRYQYGFWIIIAIALLLAICGGIILIVLTSNRRSKK